MATRVKGLFTLLFATAAAFGALPVHAQTNEAVPVGIEVRGGEDQAELVIRGHFAEPSYAVRAREEGRVVVVDVGGASLPDGGVTTTGTSPLVMRTVASTTARGVRIEVSLRRAAAYRARVEAGNIVVRFESMSDEAREAEPAVASAASESAPAAVRSIHIERRDGRERVVVELSRASEFRLVPGTVGPARLELPGAVLADGVARSLDGDSHSVIRRVRLRHATDRAVLEVDRAQGASATAIREGNRIVWMFAPDADAPDGRPASRTVARERVSPDEGGFSDGPAQTGDTGEVAGFLSDIPLQVSGARGARHYSGRRVELDFKDADVHNILRLLAEVGGVNIVAGDDVTGAVTIRMTNVPWDQALDVILQAKGLGMVRRGNLIRVAPLTTLEKERELAIARRKQQVDLEVLETRIVPVSYATAADLQPRVRELLSSRGTVSVDERTNVLIARDIVGNLDDVEELVRSLDTQTPQVLVEARIVEATSQYSRDVGIQWGGDVTMGSATGNPTGLLFPGNVGLAGGNVDAATPTGGLSPFGATPNPNFGVNLPATTGSGVGGALGVTLGSIGGNVNLNVRLSASEANGNLRIISSPRILTLDNHEAHISQGTSIPYSQVSAQGVQTAFQEAKLELRVRPHVTSDGSISMHVRITRDEPDFTRTSTRGDPTILKREAETDLLIQDGHTAVIGGIYSRTAGRNRDQIPFFGDIPIIGVLFQRRRVRDERSELLIFLTPRIVNRAEALSH
ncbi:MAG: type IV pilus secretin PilQ [Sandaracinaceae bacterium]|nr:type IV pilus secretin PilQ [Sandaracinaceae bacterium]